MSLLNVKLVRQDWLDDGPMLAEHDPLTSKYCCYRSDFKFCVYLLVQSGLEFLSVSTGWSVSVIRDDL